MPKLRVDGLLSEIAAAPAAAAPWTARLRAQALRMIEDEALAQPAFCCRVVALEESTREFLVAEGELLHAPRLWPSAGRLTALACGVATIGPALEQRVTSLFVGRQRSLALALDQLGNQLLFAVSRRLQDAMLAAGRRQGLSLAGELRPGDPGLDLEAQGALLRLAGAAQIGVGVTCTQALHPLKSVSVIFGAGIGLPAATWSRCDDCRSRPRCQIANHGDAPALV